MIYQSKSYPLLLQEDLRKIPTPTSWRKLSGPWSPAMHGDVLDLVTELCRKKEWVENPNWKIAASSSLQIMAASTDVHRPDLPVIPGCYYSLGLVNSIYEGFRLDIYAGVRLFSYDLGMTFSRLHVRQNSSVSGWEEQTKKTLDHAGARMRLFAGEVQRLNKRKMRNVQLIPSSADNDQPSAILDPDEWSEATIILIQAARLKIIPWRKAGYLNSLCHRIRSKNAWKFMRILSSAIKELIPTQQMQKLYRISTLLEMQT